MNNGAIKIDFKIWDWLKIFCVVNPKIATTTLHPSVTMTFALLVSAVEFEV